MPENVMHESCSENLIASHVLETVVNEELDINNGPSKEAQMLSKPNLCGLGEKESNNKCSEMNEAMRLKPNSRRRECDH